MENSKSNNDDSNYCEKIIEGKICDDYLDEAWVEGKTHIEAWVEFLVLTNVKIIGWINCKMENNTQTGKTMSFFRSYFKI